MATYELVYFHRYSHWGGERGPPHRTSEIEGFYIPDLKVVLIRGRTLVGSVSAGPDQTVLTERQDLISEVEGALRGEGSDGSTIYNLVRFRRGARGVMALVRQARRAACLSKQVNAGIEALLAAAACGQAIKS